MATRILVVDDERVVSEVVERYLLLDEFEVSLAVDGEEALRIARDWAPDLVPDLAPVVSGPKSAAFFSSNFIGQKRANCSLEPNGSVQPFLGHLS